MFVGDNRYPAGHTIGAFITDLNAYKKKHILIKLIFLSVYFNTCGIEFTVWGSVALLMDGGGLFSEVFVWRDSIFIFASSIKIGVCNYEIQQCKLFANWEKTKLRQINISYISNDNLNWQLKRVLYILGRQLAIKKL